MTIVTTIANDPAAFADWHSSDAPKIKLTVDDFSLSVYDDRMQMQTDDDIALGDTELDSLTFTRESLSRLRAFINNPLLDNLFAAVGQQA
jgi:hypothetical protein